MPLEKKYSLTPVQRIQLHNILNTRFDKEELRTLCFSLGVDYDGLRGEGKEGKARELIAHLERRKRVHELIKVGKQQRSDITWPDIIVQGKERTPDQDDRRSYLEKRPGQFHVETLISKIVAYHQKTTLRSRIDDELPFNSRPRTYLASVVDQPDRGEKDDITAALETALRYTFLIFGPREAMIRICDETSLESILESMSRKIVEHFPSDETDIESITRNILQAFAIPEANSSVNVSLPWSWPIVIPRGSTSLLTPLEAMRRIERTKRDLAYAIDGQRFNSSGTRKVINKIWEIIENLLRFSLAYFYLHFESYMPSPILVSLRKSSFENLIKSIQQVEELFEPPEGSSFERRQISEQLKSECRRDFGRSTPFGSFHPKKYQYATKKLDAPQGFGEVTESLHSAREIVADIIQAVIVPRIIVITGKGTDNYGNPIIWFVDKKEKEKIWESPMGFEWMYITSDMPFKMFQEVAMLAPDFEGEETEPLIDPVMYPIEQIEEFINVNVTTTQATTTPPVSDNELHSLQSQLGEARANLLLIQERMAEFVRSVDIPLQLVKEKQDLTSKIAKLEQRIEARSASRGNEYA